jgi:hypothetical protein
MRRPVEAPVVLHPRAGLPLVGSVAEVSISGMFVTARPEEFCTNSVIDVEMTLPGAVSLKTYRWQAMVIRKTATGIGLMFDRLRPPAVVALLDKAQNAPDFPGPVAAAALDAKTAATYSAAAY